MPRAVRAALAALILAPFASEVGDLLGTDAIPALLDPDRYLLSRTGLLLTWRADDEGRARLRLDGLDRE